MRMKLFLHAHADLAGSRAWSVSCRNSSRSRWCRFRSSSLHLPPGRSCCSRSERARSVSRFGGPSGPAWRRSSWGSRWSPPGHRRPCRDPSSRDCRRCRRSRSAGDRARAVVLARTMVDSSARRSTIMLGVAIAAAGSTLIARTEAVGDLSSAAALGEKRVEPRRRKPLRKRAPRRDPSFKPRH